MAFSHLPAFLTSVFSALASRLHKSSAARLPLLLAGILFARGRRTVTSWFRAAGISDDFRNGYTTVGAVGREFDHMALSVQRTVEPLLGPRRLLLGIDDSPTQRYGPCVEGAGIHHHPSPGPAGEKHLYGHIWVVLAALGKHPDWGTIALPVQAQLYIRQIDIARLPPERPRPFRTKLELAAAQLAWLKPWVDSDFEELWVAVDGGYAKKPFLRPAEATGWETVECVQYGEKVSKTVKTFLATWRPAGGVIRVVLVKEDDDWLPLFSIKAEATAVEVVEAMADRNALEQMNKDVKEVEGAGQQQVRNVHCNEGCFNMNLWMYTLVEAWAWNKEEEEVSDRSASPWDSEPRRPSHADKRRALQREILQAEIEAVLSGQPSQEDFRALAQRLLDLAA